LLKKSIRTTGFFYYD